MKEYLAPFIKHLKLHAVIAIAGGVIAAVVLFLGYRRVRGKFRRELNNIAVNKGEVLLNKNRLAYSARGLTDPGRVRENNEDSFLINIHPPGRFREGRLICAVADGMGGENYGEVASSVCVNVLREEFGRLNGRIPKDFNNVEWLKAVVCKASNSLAGKAESLKTFGAMGSTLVVAVLAGGKAYVANVGDSRAYLYRNKEMIQITRDHSLVGILAEKGLIKPEEIYTHPRRGELLKFIGQDRGIEADVFELNLAAGDTLVLCSDGLWEAVKDNDIGSILDDSSQPAEACGKLVDAANKAGGKDNITVVTVKII